MQITIAPAVALLTSIPLPAAGSGTYTAGTVASVDRPVPDMCRCIEAAKVPLHPDGLIAVTRIHLKEV